VVGGLCEVAFGREAGEARGHCCSVEGQGVYGGWGLGDSEGWGGCGVGELTTDWERGGSLRRIWEVNAPSDSGRWVLRIFLLGQEEGAETYQLKGVYILPDLLLLVPLLDQNYQWADFFPRLLQVKCRLLHLIFPIDVSLLTIWIRVGNSLVEEIDMSPVHAKQTSHTHTHLKHKHELKHTFEYSYTHSPTLTLTHTYTY
jgi:hypothetical protein